MVADKDGLIKWCSTTAKSKKEVSEWEGLPDWNKYRAFFENYDPTHGDYAWCEGEVDVKKCLNKYASSKNKSAGESAVEDTSFNEDAVQWKRLTKLRNIILCKSLQYLPEIFLLDDNYDGILMQSLRLGSFISKFAFNKSTVRFVKNSGNAAKIQARAIEECQKRGITPEEQGKNLQENSSNKPSEKSGEKTEKPITVTHVVSKVEQVSEDELQEAAGGDTKDGSGKPSIEESNSPVKQHGENMKGENGKGEQGKSEEMAQTDEQEEQQQGA